MSTSSDHAALTSFIEYASRVVTNQSSSSLLLQKFKSHVTTTRRITPEFCSMFQEIAEMVRSNAMMMTKPPPTKASSPSITLFPIRDYETNSYLHALLYYLGVMQTKIVELCSSRTSERHHQLPDCLGDFTTTLTEHVSFDALKLAIKTSNRFEDAFLNGKLQPVAQELWQDMKEDIELLQHTRLQMRIMNGVQIYYREASSARGIRALVAVEALCQEGATTAGLSAEHSLWFTKIARAAYIERLYRIAMNVPATDTTNKFVRLAILRSIAQDSAAAKSEILEIEQFIEKLNPLALGKGEPSLEEALKHPSVYNPTTLTRPISHLLNA